MKSIFARIAEQLNVNESQVAAAVALLDEGATVPFISRYRKEVTNGLDDTQLRTLEDRLRYLRELEERRATILNSIEEQEKLTPELKSQIQAAENKNHLEDLYLPYKPKRRTKGQLAISAGLQPLAEALLANPLLTPENEAEKYLNSEHKINDTKTALEGAKYILMERFSEDAELLGTLRHFLKSEALVSARVLEGKEQEGVKFCDYFEHGEPLNTIPSHRVLAILRGRNAGILSVALTLGCEEDKSASHPGEGMVTERWSIVNQGRPADKWLAEVVRWTWRVKLLPHLETNLLGDLREQAEQEAIEVFASNLKSLLLAAPAGEKVTVGLDPGLRTGVKVAVVDATGKVLDHGAMFPTAPQYRTAQAEAMLVALCKKHGVNLIAIGNGTASRETDKFVSDVLRAHPELNIQSVVVSEAGASVYSASEFAAREFPDLDVTIRGAISIARRLQDPLAELVKIEPKSIGVGQYQHDVSQSQLTRCLDTVIEDCVNAVGVEVNTASAPLLAKVSGLNQTIANNIIDFRNQNGVFNSRDQLKKVARFGDKTFQQAAGFLRIANSANPLDTSAVHPESYGVVEKIAAANGREIAGMIGNSNFLRNLKALTYTDERFGLPTVTDIIHELDKPGRDPRPEFKTAKFREGIEKISDLNPGMTLEGTITNVTNFGAFVDIGVHQDGLVHISALSNSFVKDPHKVVNAGDIVKVKVLEIDIPRKRISLSMRLDDQPGSKTSAPQKSQSKKSQSKKSQSKKPPQAAQSKKQASNTMADLFIQAKNKKGKRL